MANKHLKQVNKVMREKVKESKERKRKLYKPTFQEQMDKMERLLNKMETIR